MKKVAIVGIGMGNPDTITVKGLKLIQKADFLIGGGRMVKEFGSKYSKKVSEKILADDIMSEILSADEKIENIAVLMSGDTGFYSGTKKLIGKLEENNIEFQVVPGISSVQYFSSKIGKAWDEFKIISLHGRNINPIPYIKENKKTFLILGSNNLPENVAQKMVEVGMANLKVIVGERLSYENEKLTFTDADTASKMNFDSLSVMLVENDNAAKETITAGMSDEIFIRGKVPMTKEEIRTVSISKLELKKDDIVYDVGAGTGSVSIEIARLLPYGKVYAVETNPEGVKLIKQNSDKFGIENIEIIEGIAPEALKNLPPADKVFIGGSKGNMEQIIKEVISRNNDAVIVINAISLETISESLEVLNKMECSDYEIVQMNISKSHKIGKYNMMKGQNPIYIIKGRFANSDK